MVFFRKEHMIWKKSSDAENCGSSTIREDVLHQSVICFVNFLQNAVVIFPAFPAVFIFILIF